jgi:phage-related protein
MALGPVWARATVLLDADGNALPRQTRQAAATAGDQAGETFSKRFGRAINKNLPAAMQRFTAAFRKFTREVDFAGKPLQRLDGSMRTLGHRFGNTAPMIRFRLALMSVADAFQKVTSIFRSNSGDIENNRNSIDRNGSAWRRLSGNTRQWILIIGAVALAMGQLSVLGSALTGTLIALGTAFAGLAAGAVVLGTAFFGLYKEGANLSDGAIASKEAFSALGDTFSALQDVITNAVFENMAGSIARLNEGVKALTPAIEAFAAIAGENLARIFDALASPKGIENFQKLLDGFGPIFTSLTTAVITFGEGLANVMIAALPTAQLFSQAIADAGAAFATWTASAEGQARLAEFFQTAQTIMPPLVDLFVAAGQALSSLVPPQTIAMTVGFLDSLAGFMPALSGILLALANTNVLGVFAEALNVIGQALEPLMGPLQNLGTAIGTFLMGAITALTPLLNALGAALVPIATGFTNLLTAVGPSLFTAVQALSGLLQPLIAAIGVLAGSLLEALAPAFVLIFTVIGQLASALTPLITTLVGMLMPVFLQIVDAIGQVVTAIAPLITELIGALMPAILQIVDAFIPLIDVILETVATVIPPLIEIITMLIDTIMPLMPVIGQVASLIGAVLAAAIQVVTPILNVLIGIIRILFSVLTPIITVIIGVVQAIVQFIVQTGILQGVITALTTVVNFLGDVFNNIFSGISSVVNGVISTFNRLVSIIRNAASIVSNFMGSVGGAIGGFFGFASGGLVVGPTRALVGEAGPEAIVPLKRNLSQVDPAVRGLSAIAQGKQVPSMGNGGVVGAGRVVNIAEGAVRITGSLDPQRTAVAVLNRLAERVAG